MLPRFRVSWDKLYGNWYLGAYFHQLMQTLTFQIMLGHRMLDIFISKEGKMKKDVTETRTFCDYCEEPGYTECLMCDKDLCVKHRLEVVIYLDRQDRAFRASLCPQDAQSLLPLLEVWKGKSTTWQQAGHNPEFNEARLVEILEFLKTKGHVSTIS